MLNSLKVDNWIKRREGSEVESNEDEGQSTEPSEDDSLRDFFAEKLMKFCEFVTDKVL